MDGNTQLTTAPFRDARYAPRRLDIERRPDGTLVLANPTPVDGTFTTTLDALVHWGAAAPERVWLAERAGDGWRTVDYATGLRQVSALAGGLKGLGLKRGDCLLILARNTVDHAL
ncbi:MAG TPA: feruloyl-CoA synthase, partial [Caulobacter sp.]|nr:feruloyl-CoA synthase [Caulobacter sp.]